MTYRMHLKNLLREIVTYLLYQNFPMQEYKKRKSATTHLRGTSTLNQVFLSTADNE